MKASAALGIAVAALGLSPVASAQTRVMMEHAQTASALECLLAHKYKACGQRFVGNARLASRYWLFWSPDKQYALGTPESSDYSGTQSATAYTTKFLNGRAADVYDVRFRHQRKTFYIVPPGPDGKVEYMRVRGGAPDDEKLEGGLRAF